ncbi:MAG: uroporphyrinogen decarboxylase family protein [Candidatus Jordarchaeaceae archaeon]
MSKFKNVNIDTEIDRLAEQFKDRISKEPQSFLERFTKIMFFQEPDRMPVSTTVHQFSARVAGITIRELCTDAKKMLYAQLYTAVKFNMDTVVNLSDLYNFEPEALGAKMYYPENSWPVILEPLIKEPKDLEKLEIPDFTKAGRGPYVLEGNRLYLEKLGNYGLLSIVANGPWTLAVQLRGFNSLVRDTRKNSAFVERLLDFCVDVIEAFIKTQREAAGVAAVPNINDAFSCIPPASPQIVYDYVFPYAAELIKRLGMVLWVGGYPVCEIPQWKQIVDDSVTKTGTQMGFLIMLESDWLPVEKLKEMSNRLRIPFAFGVGSALISKGTPKEIENYIKSKIKILAPGGGCAVISDPIPVDTPAENFEAFINSIKRYGKYPIAIE